MTRGNNWRRRSAVIEVRVFLAHHRLRETLSLSETSACHGYELSCQPSNKLTWKESSLKNPIHIAHKSIKKHRNYLSATIPHIPSNIES